MQITCVTLMMDAQKFGSLHKQLTTIIPGANISKMVIQGYTFTAYPDPGETSDDPEEDAREVRKAVAPPLVATFPHHRQLLSQIMYLKFNE